MDTQHTDNVVRLKAYKSRMNTEENTKTAGLLNECQSLMTDRLSQSLSMMMDKADDVLFELAHTGTPEKCPHYFNAMREVRLKRTNIETAFRDSFISETGEAKEIEEVNVEEVNVEELLAVTNTSDKIRHYCNDALMSLDRHMHSLLDEVEVEKWQNPIYPERVCMAFQEACHNIESGTEIKLILFKLFEKYVASGLLDIYTEINSLLAENEYGKQSGRIQPGQKQSVDENQMPTESSSFERDRKYFVIANKVIRNEISRYLESAHLPEFVEEFLFVHWSKLLMKIHIRDGTSSKAWQHAVEVIDDLVKCIGNNSSLTEKRQFATIMPNLVQRLRYGMNVIPVPPFVRDEFITKLVEYHRKLFDDDSCQSGSNRAQPDDRTGNIPFKDELLVDNKKP